MNQWFYTSKDHVLFILISGNSDFRSFLVSVVSGFDSGCFYIQIFGSVLGNPDWSFGSDKVCHL